MRRFDRCDEGPDDAHGTTPFGNATSNPDESVGLSGQFPSLDIQLSQSGPQVGARTGATGNFE